MSLIWASAENSADHSAEPTTAGRVGGWLARPAVLMFLFGAFFGMLVWMALAMVIKLWWLL